MTVCVSCGRKLKSKESINRGYGSRCFNKHKKSSNSISLEEFDLWESKN